MVIKQEKGYVMFIALLLYQEFILKMSWHYLIRSNNTTEELRQKTANALG